MNIEQNNAKLQELKRKWAETAQTVNGPDGGKKKRTRSKTSTCTDLRIQPKRQTRDKAVSYTQEKVLMAESSDGGDDNDKRESSDGDDKAGESSGGGDDNGISEERRSHHAGEVVAIACQIVGRENRTQWSVYIGAVYKYLNRNKVKIWWAEAKGNRNGKDLGEYYLTETNGSSTITSIGEAYILGKIPGMKATFAPPTIRGEMTSEWWEKSQAWLRNNFTDVN